MALLTTGSGDGSLRVEVDAFGAFGLDVGLETSDAFYDPIGELTEAGTTFESGIAFRLGNEGERTFLTTGDIGDINSSGSLTEFDLGTTTDTSVASTFNYEGLDFVLTQEVTNLFSAEEEISGSNLTQTYTITNPGSETVEFELIRYIDGDLQFDGSIDDAGGRLIRNGREILFETDSGDNPDFATTFFGITATGGVTEQPGRFEIDAYSGLVDRIIAGEALDDTVTGDGPDADQFVDSGPYDLTLALDNSFVLNPGETRTYTTTTIFGSGAPEEFTPPSSGFVIDNYIAGATVFFDANQNGILDENEPNTTTDDSGAYELNIPNSFDTNNNGLFDIEEGVIVASGGTDTATGLTLETPVTALADSEVITLLTSLVTNLVDGGLSVEEANNQVTTALSIPTDIDIFNLDPILATNNNQPGGVETFAAMVKTQNVITQTAALLAGATNSSISETTDEVVAAITSEIQSSGSLNLTDTEQLESIIEAAATNANADVSEIKDEVAFAIAEANQRIDNAVANSSPDSLESEFANIQKISLDKTTSDLQQVGAGNKSIEDVVAENTGEALDDLIAGNGNVTPPDNVDFFSLEWVQQFGGTFADTGFGIAADELGNSYITGQFQLDANFGSTTVTSIINDAFVAKLDSSGDFIWVENFKSTSLESLSLGFGIDNDAVGNTYTTGFFTGTVEFGDTSLTSLGDSDIFVTKLDSNGNVIWAEQLENTGLEVDFGFGVSSDDSGNAYVIGIKDVDTETDIFDTSPVDGEGFISKINSSGDLVWTENFDSTSLSLATDIASDAVGNSYVIGTFLDDVTLGNQTFLSSGDTDIFVTKLDSDGNVEWSQSLGNTLSDTGNGIGLDKAGNIYITGSFEDSVTFGETTLTSNGESDAFVAKLDNSGNIVWAQNLGGTSLDSGTNITVDEEDNIYVTGVFEDTVTFGNTTFTSSSENDGFNLNNGFIVKLDTDGNILQAEQLDYSLLDIAAGKAGNVYGTGAFENTVTIGDTTFTSEGFTDGLVVNLDFEEIDINPNSIITTDIDGTTIEGIDLTGFATDTVTVDYTISREADFDNQVYFYAVDDITGTVGGVAVGEDGYMEAALNSLVSPVFSTSDDNTETGSLEFDAGSIVVPVIIADGTLTEALSGEAEVYFPYLGANSDNGNFDHIKLLDDNTFGFEDLPNGGDQDFNDIVIEINSIG